MAHGASWTVERQEELIRLALAGKTPQECARLLDRSVNAVIMQLAQIAHIRSQWGQAIKLIKQSQE